MIALYSIMSDGNPIYMGDNVLDFNSWDPKTTLAWNANLVIEDCKSGSLTFTINKDNHSYDRIEFMRSIIEVFEYVYDDETTAPGSPSEMNVIWRGRAINMEEDIQGNRTYVCEGALAFLGDVFQNGYITGASTDSGMYSKESLCRVYLDTLLNSSGSINGEVNNEQDSPLNGCITSFGGGYNRKVDSRHQIRLGTVNVTPKMLFEHPADPENGQPKPYYSLESDTGIAESVLDRIFATLVDQNGGHLNIRHTATGMYLDYLEDFANKREDNIATYGENILDLTKSLEISKPVTAIIPMGKTAVRESVGVTAAESDSVANPVIPEVDTFGIGSEVMFTGSYHYVASISDDGYQATPGKARITNLNPSAKHPYHLVHADDTSDVYGWVNESDISGIPKEEPAPPVEPEEPSEKPSEKEEGETDSEEKRLYHIGIRNNPDGTGVYVINKELEAKYGRIEEAVDFGDVETDEELLKLADDWFKQHEFASTSFDVSILDLGRVYGTGIKPVHLLDLVHVRSTFNDIDDYFPVTKLNIDLVNPANTVVTCNKSSQEALSERMAAEVRIQKIEKNKTAINASKINEIDGEKIIREFDKKYLPYDIDNQRGYLFRTCKDPLANDVPLTVRRCLEYNINNYKSVGANVLANVPFIATKNFSNTGNGSLYSNMYDNGFRVGELDITGQKTAKKSTVGYFLNDSDIHAGTTQRMFGDGYGQGFYNQNFSVVPSADLSSGCLPARLFILPQENSDASSSFAYPILIISVNGTTYYAGSCNEPVGFGTILVDGFNPHLTIEDIDNDTVHYPLHVPTQSGTSYVNTINNCGYMINPSKTYYCNGVKYTNLYCAGIHAHVNNSTMSAIFGQCFARLENVGGTSKLWYITNIPDVVLDYSMVNTPPPGWIKDAKLTSVCWFRYGSRVFPLMPTSIRNAPTRLYLFHDGYDAYRLMQELSSFYAANR